MRQSGYRVTFVDAKGEELDSFSIQNHTYARKELTEEKAVYYLCTGELGAVGERLESLEAVLFPDYNKDPDFPN
ncbi:MAG: hypothetical protein NC420_04300 [Eubacterium sp.]|nr:hypothetical protein [Eubacterium sp.]MCM1304288.1 hypothetical protein [Butyrivibrio sp.]